VGHIRHENRAACVGDFAHLIVVDVARVCRRAGNEDLGPEEEGVLHELLVVDDTGRLVQPVRHLLEVKRRCRDLLAGNFKTLKCRQTISVSYKRATQAIKAYTQQAHCNSPQSDNIRNFPWQITNALHGTKLFKYARYGGEKEVGEVG
jgi:hypothetical protein